MVKKGKRKYDLQKTKHHIIPESRSGSSGLENIAMVPRINHEKYHSLFDNKTPTEIIEYLVNDYWEGQWYHVYNAYRRNNDK